MKLIASLILRNEMARYLEPCVLSLQEFCDEIRVLDDGSSDGSYEWLSEHGHGVFVLENESFRFFQHEGKARNKLLDWTLQGSPTHILAIDADEFIADGRALRAAIDMDDEQPVWTIEMGEVWKADEESLWLRRDGGWRSRAAPILYRVPEKRGNQFRIMDRALACGREPMEVRAQFRKSLKTGTEILHFGWTNEAGREQRYQRYVEHDGGKFHSSSHLQSIMAPDKRVQMTPRSWPVGLQDQKAAILERVNG
jgi:glycosyltransferase involved in cell wall biosynthesis